jgi:hypothetical protein
MRDVQEAAGAPPAPAGRRRTVAAAAPLSSRRTMDIPQKAAGGQQDGAEQANQRPFASVKRRTAPLVQKPTAVESESDEDWHRMLASRQGKLSAGSQPTASQRPVTARQTRAAAPATPARLRPPQRQLPAPSAAAADADSSDDDDWLQAKLRTTRLDCCCSTV